MRIRVLKLFDAVQRGRARRKPLQSNGSATTLTCEPVKCRCDCLYRRGSPHWTISATGSSVKRRDRWSKSAMCLTRCTESSRVGPQSQDGRSRISSWPNVNVWPRSRPAWCGRRSGHHERQSATLRQPTAKPSSTSMPMPRAKTFPSTIHDTL